MCKKCEKKIESFLNLLTEVKAIPSIGKVEIKSLTNEDGTANINGSITIQFDENLTEKRMVHFRKRIESIFPTPPIVVSFTNIFK